MPDIVADQLFLKQAQLAARLLTGIEEARASPLGLYKLLFSADDGGPVIIKDFHHEWNQAYMDPRSCLIEASRGLTKTSYIQAAALWSIGNNPNIRIKWVGPNDGNAQKRLRVISQHIKGERSQLFGMVFPECQLDRRRDAPNNTEMLTVERDMITSELTVEAKGILSSGTGDRCDLMVLDDAADYKNTLLHPATRAKTVDKLKSDWLPTLAKGGKIVSIHTPWHDEDINAYLKKATNWRYIRHAHGKPNDPYYSIFPELFSPERLRELHAEEGDIHYARGRLCKAVSGDTAAILPEHLAPYDASILTPSILEQAIAILIIDPSSGKQLHKGKLDYTGVAVLLFYPMPGRNPPYMIFVPEAYQIRIPTPRQVELIVYLMQKWGCTKVLIEQAGMQNLHEWLAENQAVIPPSAIWPVTTGNVPKGQRLIEVSNFFQQGDITGEPCLYFHPRVVDPQPQEFLLECANWAQPALRSFRHQVLSFPTQHDDVMDAVVHGLRHIKQHYIPELMDGEPTGATVEVVRLSGKREEPTEPDPEEMPPELPDCISATH